MTWEEYEKQWVKNNTCKFCRGSRMHTCTFFRCEPARNVARAYLYSVVAKGEVASGNRKFVGKVDVGDRNRKIITGAWIMSDNKKEELVIRFRDEVPKMQQAVIVGMITGSVIMNLAGKLNISVREWKSSDEKPLRKESQFRKTRI